MYIGVDFFGFFYIKWGYSIEKVYGCIFVCLYLRVIYIKDMGLFEIDVFI